MNTSSYFVVSPPIEFDAATCSFTNIDAYKSMVLKELCPSVNMDAELNRAAIWLLCNPAKRPDGSYELFMFLVERLGKAQARRERLQSAVSA